MLLGRSYRIYVNSAASDDESISKQTRSLHHYIIGHGLARLINKKILGIWKVGNP